MRKPSGPLRDFWDPCFSFFSSDCFLFALDPPLVPLLVAVDFVELAPDSDPSTVLFQLLLFKRGVDDPIGPSFGTIGMSATTSVMGLTTSSGDPAFPSISALSRSDVVGP